MDIRFECDRITIILVYREMGHDALHYNMLEFNQLSMLLYFNKKLI